MEDVINGVPVAECGAGSAPGGDGRLQGPRALHVVDGALRAQEAAHAPEEDAYDLPEALRTGVRALRARAGAAARASRC